MLLRLRRERKHSTATRGRLAQWRERRQWIADPAFRMASLLSGRCLTSWQPYTNACFTISPMSVIGTGRSLSRSTLEGLMPIAA